MNYDELAALQRNLQAWQSAQQHRELMRQLERANESPVLREIRLEREAEQAQYDEEHRWDWLVELLVYLLIAAIVFGSIYAYCCFAERREADLNAARGRAAAQAEKAAAQAAEQAKQAAAQAAEKAKQAALEARERVRVAEIERRRIWGLSHQSEAEDWETKQIAIWKKRALEGDADGRSEKYYRETIMAYKPTTGEGQYNFGVSRLTDPILGTDEGAAKTWLTKAAAQGHERAARKLAELNGPRTP